MWRKLIICVMPISKCRKLTTCATIRWIIEISERRVDPRGGRSTYIWRHSYEIHVVGLSRRKCHDGSGTRALLRRIGAIGARAQLNRKISGCKPASFRGYRNEPARSRGQTAYN